jgi:hypothetical protein
VKVVLLLLLSCSWAEIFILWGDEEDCHCRKQLHGWKTKKPTLMPLYSQYVCFMSSECSKPKP